MNKKKINVYDKQLKKTEYLHMLCNGKTRVVNMDDVFAYNGEVSNTNSDSKFELKKRFLYINNYISDATDNCDLGVVAFTSSSKKFDLNKANLVGVFSNGLEVNALDDLAESIITDTFKKSKKVISENDIVSLQESYIFINGLKKGVY